MEEEGAENHPDGLLEPKTDARVHWPLCKGYQCMDCFYFLFFFRGVLLKTFIIWEVNQRGQTEQAPRQAAVVMRWALVLELIFLHEPLQIWPACFFMDKTSKQSVAKCPDRQENMKLCKKNPHYSTPTLGRYMYGFVLWFPNGFFTVESQSQRTQAATGWV